MFVVITLIIILLITKVNAKEINYLENLTIENYDINFNNWKQHTSANIQFIILLSLLFISTVFATIGIIRIKRNKY